MVILWTKRPKQTKSGQGSLWLSAAPSVKRNRQHILSMRQSLTKGLFLKKCRDSKLKRIIISFFLKIKKRKELALYKYVYSEWMSTASHLPTYTHSSSSWANPGLWPLYSVTLDTAKADPKLSHSITFSEPLAPINPNLHSRPSLLLLLSLSGFFNGSQINSSLTISKVSC